MSEQVISFVAAQTDRATLEEVLASHLAYEEARVVRSLGVRRIVVLSTAITVFLRIVHVLSWSAGLVVAAVTAAALGCLVRFEQKARARKYRALAAVPHEVGPTSAADVAGR